MKTKLFVITLVVLLLTSLGFLGRIGYLNHKLEVGNQKLNKELMKADLEKGRALTQLGDANRKISSLEVAIQKEIKEREAEITRYGELELRYRVLEKEKKGKTIIEYTEGPPVEVDCDGLIFVPGVLYQAITSNTIMPVKYITGEHRDHRLRAFCTFRSAYARPGNDRNPPFFLSYELNLKLRGQFVETLTPSGAINHYATVFEVDPNGRDMGKLELVSFEVIVDDKRFKKMHWWVPRVDVGLLIGSQYPVPSLSSGGSIGVSLMGYGKAQQELTWRFPRLSIDYSGSPGLGLTAVLYNLGEPLPLVRDLWVGPHVMWGLDNEGFLGLLVSSVL